MMEKFQSVIGYTKYRPKGLVAILAFEWIAGAYHVANTSRVKVDVWCPYNK